MPITARGSRTVSKGHQKALVKFMERGNWSEINFFLIFLIRRFCFFDPSLFVTVNKRNFLMSMAHTDKQLILFDLDGTLTESKSALEAEMADLLAELLGGRRVAVISGGSYAQFQKQFLGYLSISPQFLSSLYIFPTCATCFYRYDEEGGGWVNIYEENFTAAEKARIKRAFSRALRESGFKASGPVYGELIEDRGSQITFSAFGQEAPLSVKKDWDPDHSKRLSIKKALERLIPEFEIHIGGSTSVDVTRKGIDKAYGIMKIEQHLGIAKEMMLFIGDALFPGGNDYPVKRTGVECMAVSGPEETKEIIRSLLSS
jgi:HAD superfamily hydrolase (TIGR01484 family)